MAHRRKHRVRLGASEARHQSVHDRFKQIAVNEARRAIIGIRAGACRHGLAHAMNAAWQAGVATGNLMHVNPSDMNKTLLRLTAAVEREYALKCLRGYVR
jgi:hypothetical protein